MSTFQQPGERVDPGEVCALLAAILAHGCNLGLYTMEKVAPDIAYRRLKKNVSDWRLVEENQRAALAAIVHGISRLAAAGHWGDGTTSAGDGQRFAMPQKVLQRTYSTRFNDFALDFYSFVADNYAPFYSRPVECTDRDAPFVLDGVLYHESTSISKSTTPTRTATPRSTSPRSAWSPCGSALESAASTASGSIVPTRPATTASSSRSSSAAVGR